jgi:hypothetical protein
LLFNRWTQADIAALIRHEIGHCNGWRHYDSPVVAAPLPRPRPPAVVAAAAPQYRAHPCPVTALLTLGIFCF